MRVRVFRLFGREVARLEDHDGAAPTDPDEDDRLADLTDRVVWDALHWDE